MNNSQVFLKNQDAVTFVDNRLMNLYHHAKEENGSTQLLADILQCKEIVSRVFAEQLSDRSQTIFDVSLHRNALMQQENNQMAKIIDEQCDQLLRQKDIIDKTQKAMTRCRTINLEWMSNYDKTSAAFQEANKRLEKMIEELESKNKDLEEQITKQKVAVIKGNNQNVPPLPELKGLDCKICFTEFDENRFPMVGPCGHSLCKECLDQLPNLICPFCQRQNAYQRPAKNYLAWEVLEEARRQQNY